IPSVDREGTKKGFDTELLKNVTELTKLPIIASGGMGRLDDFKSVSSKANVDAVAIATVFHYDLISVQDVRDYGLKNKINLRNFR
ncbi:imidazole glycerol phosphate synthase cyclase subunit, partial [Pelagibacterales bacterium SAG-MED04]|nr:imidazole glycerol phosphate synthase cyclase subunit [Pelagibacterales bacterium SAG-MED04]